MQTKQMQLSADQIVQATSDWPDPSVDKAWNEETRRRIADMESGKVQGIPLEDTLAKARKFTGQ